MILESYESSTLICNVQNITDWKIGLYWSNSNLNLLFERALCYEDYRENFRESLLNNIAPFGFHIEKSSVIVPVNEDFHIKWHSILKNAEKQLVELLLTESETIIAKIQLEVDQPIDALFLEESQDIRPALEEKNHEMKKQLEKGREKKWKKFTGSPDYGHYTPKAKSLKEKKTKKQVTKTSNGQRVMRRSLN